MSAAGAAATSAAGSLLGLGSAAVGAAVGVATVGLASTAAQTWLSATTRNLAYKSNQRGPNVDVSPEQAIRSYYAGLINEDMLAWLLLDHGIKWTRQPDAKEDYRWHIWRQTVELQRPYAPFGLLRDLWVYADRPAHGYPYGLDRLRDLLARQGITDRQEQNAVLQSPRHIDAETIRRMYWQRVLSHDEAMQWLARLGYLDPTSAKLILSEESAFPIEDATYLYQTEQLDDFGIKAYLRRTGILSDVDHDRFLKSRLRQLLPQQMIAAVTAMADDDDFAKRWGLDRRFPVEHKAAWQAAGQWWGEGVSLPDLQAGTAPRLPVLQWRAHWQLPGLAQAMRLYQYVRPYNVDRWSAVRDEAGRQVFPNLKPFSLQQLGDAANASGIAPEAVQQMAAAMYVPLSRRDITRGLTVGILDPQRLLESYRDIGYSPQDASLLARIQTSYIDYQKQAPLRAAQSRLIKEQTDAELSLYQSGGQDRSTTIGALVGLGYPAELAASAVDLSPAVWTVRFAARAQQQAMQSGLRSVLSLYQLGAMPDAEAAGQLAALGIPAQSAAVLLGEEKLKQRQRVARAGLAAVRADYRRGLLTSFQVADKLLTFGLTPEAARSYAAEWAAGMSDVRRRLSTAEIGKFVVDGIMSLADARHRLVNLGWSAGDIPLWLAEWEAKAAAAVAKKAKASQPKPTKTQPAPTNGAAAP